MLGIIFRSFVIKPKFIVTFASCGRDMRAKTGHDSKLKLTAEVLLNYPLVKTKYRENIEARVLFWKKAS